MHTELIKTVKYMPNQITQGMIANSITENNPFTEQILQVQKKNDKLLRNWH